MTSASQPFSRQQADKALAALRALADQAFSRAAGAPRHREITCVLRDATEYYPAWLDAIRSAETSTSRCLKIDYEH